MSKKQLNSAPQIVIDPQKIENGGAYWITGPKEMNHDELIRFRLLWNKAINAAGIDSWAVVLPAGTEVEELATPALQQLQKRITDTLKAREEA